MTKLDRYLALAAVTIAGTLGYSPAVYGFTLYLTPFEQEFGWSRTLLGGVIAIFWLSAPLSPIIGRLTDRFGVRRLLLAGIAVESVGFVALTLVQDITSLYFIRATMGIGKICIVTAMVVAIPFWFHSNMGWAYGIAMAGLHGGGIIFAPLTEVLIDAFGWRVTSFYLGIAIAVLAVPPVLLWVKSEQGNAAAEQNDASVSGQVPSDEGYTLKEALRSVQLWLLAGITLVYFGAYSGLLGHMAPYLSDLGFSREVTSGLVGTIAGSAAIAVFIWGLVIDRVESYRYVLMALFSVMLLVMLGAIGVSVMSTTLATIALTIAFGICVGCDSVWFTTLRKTFGPKQFGAIYGVWYFFALMALNTFPFFVGYVFDLSRSYIWAFGVLSAALSVCILVIAIPSLWEVGGKHAGDRSSSR